MNIVPPPDRLVPVPAIAPFEAGPDTVVTAFSAELLTTAAWLRGVLAVAPVARPGGEIRLAVDPALGPESYRLKVRTDSVLIEGGDPAGVFYGAQTLRQLLPTEAFRAAAVRQEPWLVPAVEVEDSPRFAWRGCMLDVARHFLPKADVLRFIELLALHKINVLHLHLTDDQGWRPQIRRYPRLTEIGAWRRETAVGVGPSDVFDGRPHGGFYTQNDLREIVAHAAARHITVVPEIDVPGHSRAAIAAYPHLGVSGEPLEVETRWGVCEDVLNAEESTVRFYEDVLDEILDIFPGTYVHIGGDECPRTRWRGSPRVQERIKELGLADEDELQSWFIGRLASHLRSRGRRVLGWDEILDGGLSRDATVAAWRGTDRGVAAARAGHDVVMCPHEHTYFDYRQSEQPGEPLPFGSVLTLADAYSFEPVPPGLAPEEAGRILGAQCQVWTEYIDSPRRVDYMAFPRLCAFAEAVWSRNPRDFAGFQARLEEHLHRLDGLGVEYRPLAGPHPWQRDRPA
ncbi:beta-N-acetylhexosaminidase [Streptomyces sp. NPDC047981]|uniref:beta-N-acetylhexosaminidase n=1 Tax=Streptomyces sp. NPDC047981 TaxID=3154610 RepID=UPI00341A1C25